MESINISFSANGQQLTGGGLYCASNTVHYIIADFELGDGWQGFDSVRAVWSNDFKCISTVLDPDGSCTVPHEVLERRGKVSVNLVGSILEDDELTDRLTTYPVLAITVDANAKICGTETAEVTPSQFEQFVNIVHDEVAEVTGMSAEATTLPEGSEATASYSDGVLSFGIPKGDTGAQGATGPQGPQGEPGEVTLAQLSAVLPTDTASGAIASFEDGSDLFDYLSCIVNIEPVQAGSGTPSPDNVRPITGWTGCEVINDPTYGGYVYWNQLLNNTNKTTQTINGITFTVMDNGAIKASGTATADARFDYNRIDFLKNHVYITVGIPSGCSETTYYVVTTGVVYADTIYKYNVDDYWTTRLLVKQGTTVNDVVFCPLCIDLTLLFGATKANEIYAMEQTHKGDGVAYFKSLFPKDYYAYNVGEKTNVSEVNGTPYGQYNITWQTEAGTVYGGTVDLVSGLLTVTHALEKFSDKTWIMNGTRLESTLNGTFTTETRPLQISSAYNFNLNILGSNYQNYSGCFATIVSDRRILIYDERFTSADKISEFIAQMGNETICYKLATPQTYQLDPVQVACLLGQNNVWADCGDIGEVKYKADVQKWVEKQLREINTAILALS